MTAHLVPGFMTLMTYLLFCLIFLCAQCYFFIRQIFPLHSQQKGNTYIIKHINTTKGSHLGHIWVQMLNAVTAFMKCGNAYQIRKKIKKTGGIVCFTACLIYKRYIIIVSVWSLYTDKKENQTYLIY